MTQPADYTAHVEARFVDDDDLVRTGRALVELDGLGFVHVPVPEGWEGHVSAVMDASGLVEGINADAAKIKAAADEAKAALESTGWDGDRLTVLGRQSPPLTGPRGFKGDPGTSPHVGEDGRWRVGNTDTGVIARGPQGDKGDKGDKGEKGDRGEDGTSVRPVGTVETSAALPEAATVGDGYVVQDTGHMWVWSGTDWVDVGPLQGPKGDPGQDGASTWEAVQGKPTEFPPETHTHIIKQVDGLEEALANAGGPPVIVSTTPPEDTDAIWVNPDEVPDTPPTGGGTAEQDTGWRSIAGTVKLWPTDTWDATKDTLWIRRVGSVVHLMHKRSTDITANSWGVGDLIPAGFRPAVDTGLIVHGRDNNTGGYLLRTSGMTVWTGPVISSAYFMAPVQSWPTTDPWPTTLPGTAVEGL